MPLTESEIQKLVLETAALSKAQKRKVGAILIRDGQVIGRGCNNNMYDNGVCEDEEGNTLPTVVHAEIACLEDAERHLACTIVASRGNCIMYVSHQPCESCRDAIIRSGVTDIRVVEAFMKFDGDKLRYDLVPPSATEALARVLTFGARKYKPNNWRNVPEPDRYIAAMKRHIALYRSGEKFDEDSGLHHLAHAMTNMAFLLDLDYQPPVLGNAQLEKP